MAPCHLRLLLVLDQVVVQSLSSSSFSKENSYQRRTRCLITGNISRIITWVIQKLHFSVNLNDCIQLWVMKPAPVKDTEDGDDCKKNVVQRIIEDKVEEEKSKATKIIEELHESKYFKCGDIVDILDLDDSESAGAYFEGEIVKIAVEEGNDAVEDGLTYFVKYDAYDGDDYRIKLHQLCPRARKILKSRELEADMEVLVNYNLQDPGRRGCWFRGKVEKVRPHLLCTLYVGVDQTSVKG